MAKTLIKTDDSLRLVTEKTRTDGTGYKIGLTDNWRYYTEIAHDKNGKAKIYSYCHKETCGYIGGKEYAEMSSHEQSKYTACYERMYKPTGIDNAIIRLRSNNIFLELHKLGLSDEQTLLASRYRKTLESLFEVLPNIIKYEPRTQKPTDRHFQEAVRQKLKRWFRLYEYEYCIIVNDPTFAKQLYSDFEQTAKKNINGTLYLKGYAKSGGNTRIKYYDLEHNDHALSGLFKLEITFGKKVFDRLNDRINKKNLTTPKINIQNMTYQENCIELLEMAIQDEIENLKGGEAVKRLQQEYFITTQDNVLARIVRLEQKLDKGLSQHDKELSHHDKELSQLKQRLERLEKLEQRRI